MKRKLSVALVMVFCLSITVEPVGAQDEGTSSDSTSGDESSDQQSELDTKAAKRSFKKYLRNLNRESANLESESADGEDGDAEFYSCCYLDSETHDDETGCTTRADNPHLSSSKRRSGRGSYIKGKGAVRCASKVPYIRVAVKLQTQRWWGTWQSATGWYIRGKANRTEWYHSAELKFDNHQGRFRTLVASDVKLRNGVYYRQRALSPHTKITNPD